MDSILDASACINVQTAITTTQTAAARLGSQEPGRNSRNPSQTKVDPQAHLLKDGLI